MVSEELKCIDLLSVQFNNYICTLTCVVHLSKDDFEMAPAPRAKEPEPQPEPEEEKDREEGIATHNF